MKAGHLSEINFISQRMSPSLKFKTNLNFHQVPRRQSLINSANIETAISAGFLAFMSNPAGPFIRRICFSCIPLFLSLDFLAEWVCLLPRHDIENKGLSSAMSKQHYLSLDHETK